MRLNEISKEIIGAAIEVHREIGPGENEAVYEQCLNHELRLRHLPCVTQQPLPVFYKGINLDCGYRPDLVAIDSVIVEIKALEILLPIHDAQLLTYMKLGRWKLGLLLNFNVPLLKEGIRRYVLDYDEDDEPVITKTQRQISNALSAPATSNMKCVDSLTEAIIGAAIEVHRELGPGLLVSAHHACFCHELKIRQMVFELQRPLRFDYKGLTLDSRSSLDLVVEDRVAVKLKSVDELTPLHTAQLRSQMRLAGCETGLLVNFNVPILTMGVQRIQI